MPNPQGENGRSMLSQIENVTGYHRRRQPEGTTAIGRIERILISVQIAQSQESENKETSVGECGCKRRGI